MNRVILTSGLLLCGVVGAVLAARDWNVLAIGVAMLHVSVPATVAAYGLDRQADPSAVATFALGTGTGFAPAATVLWTTNLLDGGSSGGSALWISYVITAVTSLALITAYRNAYGRLVSREGTAMMKGFGASAAPIPVVLVFVLLLPEAIVKVAVFTLAIGLPGGLLAFDVFGRSGRVPSPDATAPDVPLSQWVGRGGTAFVCALAAGMNPFYAFNDPARGLGSGLGLTIGLGLCAFASVMGPVSPTPSSHQSRGSWIRAGLAVGGVLLALLSVALGVQ